jgi:hypothetical protein
MAEKLYEMQIINPMARLPFHQQIENYYRDSLSYPAEMLQIIPLLEL